MTASAGEIKKQEVFMKEFALSVCTGCGSSYALPDNEDYYCSNCHANMARLEHLTKTFQTIAQEFLVAGYDKTEVKEAMIQAVTNEAFTALHSL